MTPQPPSAPFVIDQAHLRRARNLARESGRSVMAELECLNNGTSDELVQQVAKLFSMTPINESQLWNLKPAFDLLPLSLARCWQCLLFREVDGTLIGVLADPFDPDLQLWLNSQAHGAVFMRLASSTDLWAYLCEPAVKRIEVKMRHAPSYNFKAEPTDQMQVAVQLQEITRAVLRQAMRR